MAYTRISARRGSVVDLEARFLNNGVSADPFAIYRVEIYRGRVAPENIVDIIQLPSPDGSAYPHPLTSGSTPGFFTLPWSVPADAVVPDVYFDVWYFWSVDPRESNSSADELSENEGKLINICNRFWVYPDQWYLDGGLSTIRLGFEPLDLKFHKPEVRPLEVGIMPLPLYDYDFNLVAPLIPYLEAKITVKTENDEIVIDDQPMTIKLRQGAYRTNPFVLSYRLDSNSLFIGTYKYRITVTLPDGTTRASGNYILTVA